MAPNNQFNARSDHAAQAIKATMKDARTGEQVKPRPVPVDADGNPAQPLPPEGSYARMAIERQRQEAAANRPNLQGNVQQQQEASVQPQGQPTVVPQEQHQEADQLSPNVQRRFSELSNLLRAKDQELQQIKAQANNLQETHKQTQAKLTEAEQRYNQLVQQNLESLDPETRHQVLSDVRMQEAMQRLETNFMAKVAPILNGMQARSAQEDLAKLAEKYPGFNMDIHVPLIEIFRERNPHCSVEQAFRAVAQDEELNDGRSNRAAAIPPIAMPSNGNAAPRYVPVEPKTTPEQEIEELRQRAFALQRSDKPEDKRIAGRVMDEYLRKKVGHRLPGQATQRRG